MSVLALEFGNAGLLSLLVLVPVVVAGYVLAQRRRPRYAARFTNLDLLASVVPRTPRSQSSAIATLWIASPATSTTRAICPKRPALVNDRHQGQTEIDNPDATGEERGQLSVREQVNLVRPALSDARVDRARGSSRKPMDKREPRVHLDRKASVRGRHEDAPADT